MKHTIITFEDHGQDFLTWTIDENGTIIACTPFQFSVWRKWTVEMSDFKVGGFVDLYKKGGDSESEDDAMTIRYPIAKVEIVTA